MAATADPVLVALEEAIERRPRRRPASMPPGPPGGALTNASAWLLRPIATLERCHRRYGDVFTIDLGPLRRFCFTADPAHAEALFTRRRETALAGRPNAEALQTVLGTASVLTSDGRRHLRQRKLLLPPFHGARLEGYRGRIAELAEEMVDRWPSGEVVHVAPPLATMTLQLILDVVFGVRDEARRVRLAAAFPPLLELALLEVAAPPLMADLGSRSPGGRLARLKAEVDGLIAAEIAEHRARPEPGDDVLSLLIAARDEDGEALTDAELRDELMTLLVAGHDTTATALAWAIDLVLHVPGAYERTVAAAREGDTGWLDAVARESLRLTPVVPNVVRVVTEDTPLGPYVVPAGDVISPAIHLVHRRADLFPEPRRFRPQRWLDGDTPPYAFLPFGGGIRRCIGAGLALLEMAEVLRVVFSRVGLEPVEPRCSRPRRRAVMSVPANGVPVRVLR